MKRISILMLALVFMAGEGYSQKKTVAVYVTGGQEEGANDMLSASLKEAITKSKDYVAVERTDSFLQQLRKEQKYQKSGNVDDSDIARLGRESGAKYVCVAEIMPVSGGDFITARLIGVENASVVSTADGADKITSLEMLMRVSESIAAQLVQDASQNQSGISKARVAVYVTGGEAGDRETNKILGIKLVSAITKSVQYAAMERTNAFLKQLQNEQDYQSSGNVDDDQLAALGKQFGVQYVCAAKVSKAYGSKALTVSLIDVETANVKAISKAALSNSDINSLISITQKISREIAGKTTEEIKREKLEKLAGLKLVFVEGTGGIPSFYIGKYEVTQAEWQKIMGNNPSYFKGANRPVEKVSWNDVQEFLRKLNVLTGGNFRLPTEAEWEYAAKGGLNKDNYEYAGSNTIGTVAWFADNSGDATHPVGTKQANSIGIYDMSGNVWEWCQDCYDSSCSYRVYRGGSWNRGAGYCRVADRGSLSPGSSGGNLGFRLACSSE